MEENWGRNPFSGLIIFGFFWWKMESMRNGKNAQEVEPAQVKERMRIIMQ